MHDHDHEDDGMSEMKKMTRECSKAEAFKEGCSKKFESAIETFLFITGVVTLVLCVVDFFVAVSVHFYLGHIFLKGRRNRYATYT